MTIILGTDFSAQADAAAEVASRLAGRRKTPLVMVHAIQDENRGDGPVSPEANTGLAERAAALRSPELEVRERLEVGSADQAVCSIAAEESAALIVVAATSRGAAGRLLGTTADRIAASADTPILVVRSGFPIREWLDGSRPLRVTLATDLSPISNNAVEWAAALGELGPCRFTVAHVVWPRETYDRLGVEGPMQLDQTHPAVALAVRRDLEATAARLKEAGESEIVVEAAPGRAAGTLNRIAEETSADLLVVGHHPGRMWRVWEGSVAREVMRSAAMSVACVPDTHALHPQRRPRILRVIAATDLSHPGNSAVAYAMSSVDDGGHVTVVHVMEDENVDAAERKQLIDGLSMLTIDSELSRRKVTASVELIESDERAAAICDAADRAGADLICIASGGRSRLPRILMGSVAQEVLLLSRRPVLVVPALD